ncbi:MAG: hypothetical protein RLZ83_1887 [Pseudomonadota bacterium]|jgi:succinate dehydrogenase/fumarate reductase flavoprotein subunit
MDTRFDIVVIGSGAAGLTAATVAAVEGRRVLLLEASPWVGGTTAISGGMVWIPANHKMAPAGLHDSMEAARAYLEASVPPAADAAPLQAFLDHGDEAIRDLEARTTLRLQPVLRYPDYYPERPGSTLGGRVLEPVPFDARVLGREFLRLRPPLPEFTLFGGMMIGRADIPHLRRAWRSPRSAWRVAGLLARYVGERLSAPRGTSLVLGNALAGRLFHAALKAGVEVRTGMAVGRLLVRDGRVTGVEAGEVASGSAAASLTVQARLGVILACGGISHDLERRAAHVPALAGSLSATVPSGATCSGAALAEAVGGRLDDDPHQQAFWVPASQFRRPDGTHGVYPHTVADRAKPGLIAVDRQGQRFTNEAVSYHEFVNRQLQAGPQAVPAFLVCDRRFLWRYGLGAVKPFSRALRHPIASGYLKTAPSIPALAQTLGLPPAALEATVNTWNRDARRGEDPAFGRGGNAYQRHLGDADHGPNPCVAPIEQAPYFAVEVRPADLGMAAGLVGDAKGRVLAADGQPIPGLYACGNDLRSVMNGAYPGPGITLGPALVFGWLAARHAASQG